MCASTWQARCELLSGCPCLVFLHYFSDVIVMLICLIGKFMFSFTSQCQYIFLYFVWIRKEIFSQFHVKIPCVFGIFWISVQSFDDLDLYIHGFLQVLNIVHIGKHHLKCFFDSLVMKRLLFFALCASARCATSLTVFMNVVWKSSTPCDTSLTG